MKPLALYYLTYLDRAKKAAHDLGYCLAVHGSMERDLDLLAVPWVEAAAEPEALAEAVRDGVNGRFEQGREGRPNPTQRPHGRLAWSILLGQDEDNFAGAYVDLSVMPLRRCMEA